MEGMAWWHIPLGAFVGVVVFLVGQFVIRFVFDPVIELRRTVGEIGHALTYYADQYMNPGTGRPEDMAEARAELRRLASGIRTGHTAVVWYWITQRLALALNPADLLIVSRDLTGLSNSVHVTDPAVIGHLLEANRERRKRIERLLRLPNEEPQGQPEEDQPR